MQVRRFSSDMKERVPGNHRGLYAVPIHVDAAAVPEEKRKEIVKRGKGLAISTDRPFLVAAMYIEPHGAMEEHSASVPVLFLVVHGRGFVRIGGPAGETREVAEGDAVLWPAGLDHMVWTEDEPLEAIVIDGPPERG